MEILIKLIFTVREYILILQLKKIFLLYTEIYLENLLI